MGNSTAIITPRDLAKLFFYFQRKMKLGLTILIWEYFTWEFPLSEWIKKRRNTL